MTSACVDTDARDFLETIIDKVHGYFGVPMTDMEVQMAIQFVCEQLHSRDPVVAQTSCNLPLSMLWRHGFHRKFDSSNNGFNNFERCLFVDNCDDLASAIANDHSSVISHQVLGLLIKMASAPGGHTAQYILSSKASQLSPILSAVVSVYVKVWHIK